LSSRLTRWQQKEFSMVINELEADLLQRKDLTRPIFLYTQPADVHTLSLTLHGQQVEVTPHPGFNDKYASAVEQVDQTFGAFIEFLKKQNLYENSIVIVTADHGESLGEMGRLGHVSNVTPEVARIPLLIHLPERLRTGMYWDANAQVSLHDLTPTLYYLLGHRPLKRNEMLGHPLFTLTREEQDGPQSDHFLLMSSYMPVFGILSRDQKELFVVDASLRRNYYYNLADDPLAFKNRITVPIRDHYEPILRQDLEKIDKFYGLTESELDRR
jgi:arylsulfatase A-like enzyme